MRTAILFCGSLALVLFSGASRVEASDDQTSGLKTFSSIGKGSAALDGYKEAELLVHEGKGCLTHMWFGGDWPGYEKTRIRVYVDGEKQASIDMELGMGHGQGFGNDPGPWGGSKFGKTGQPSGIYNSYRIPFGKTVRVTAQRDKNCPSPAPFWWIVRGTENLSVSLGGVKLPENARLKLITHENFRAKPLEEFDLCDLKGSGALYQVTIAAKGLELREDWKSLSFLEACMRGYFDGSSTPTLLSSGLEDYFLGTYYFNKGKYANDLAGLTHFDPKERSFSAYRFHDDDPIFFKSGFRLTCRCGETEDGSKNGKMMGDPPPTEYSTYAWVYTWEDKDSVAAFPKELVEWAVAPESPVFKGTGGETWDNKIRERGYILIEDGTYHLWYTGYNPDKVKMMSLGHATSPDGIHFTRDPANPLTHDLWTEDMCVLHPSGKPYFMFAEGKDDIAHMLLSKDRLHWEEQGPLDIRKVDGQSIGPGSYGTPTVWLEDGVWNLFYERGDQGVWLARSKDAKTWTNVQDDPVLAMGPEPYDQFAVAMNQVIKRDGVYYCLYHANANKPWKDWTTDIARSKDLVHWEKYSGNPIIENNSSSGIFVDASDGLRLYTMHPEVRLHVNPSKRK